MDAAETTVDGFYLERRVLEGGRVKEKTKEEVAVMAKENKENGSKELKVIGAGLSRTGTLSTRYVYNIHLGT